MPTPIMIEAEGLSKQYGSFLAVRDVTFEVPRGQVVAFLGPNGAGKTTTMRLLTGFLAPTEGTARIAGIDVQADRIAAAEHLGYLPENGPLYPDMTPRGLLHDPEVLIMDEPTNGLDPNQIKGVRQLIRELGKSKTVFVSTHILQEVQPVAHRVLFIHDGRIVFDGPPLELVADGRPLEEQFYRLTAQPV